jgi:hypothetical protein
MPKTRHREEKKEGAKIHRRHRGIERKIDRDRWTELNKKTICTKIEKGERIGEEIMRITDRVQIYRDQSSKPTKYQKFI